MPSLRTYSSTILLIIGLTSCTQHAYDRCTVNEDCFHEEICRDNACVVSVFIEEEEEEVFPPEEGVIKEVPAEEVASVKTLHSNVRGPLIVSTDGDVIYLTDWHENVWRRTPLMSSSSNIALEQLTLDSKDRLTILFKDMASQELIELVEQEDMTWKELKVYAPDSKADDTFVMSYISHIQTSQRALCLFSGDFYTWFSNPGTTQITRTILASNTNGWTVVEEETGLHGLTCELTQDSSIAVALWTRALYAHQAPVERRLLEMSRTPYLSPTFYPGISGYIYGVTRTTRDQTVVDHVVHGPTLPASILYLTSLVSGETRATQILWEQQQAAPSPFKTATFSAGQVLITPHPTLPEARTFSIFLLDLVNRSAKLTHREWRSDKIYDVDPPFEATDPYSLYFSRDDEGFWQVFYQDMETGTYTYEVHP